MRHVLLGSITTMLLIVSCTSQPEQPQEMDPHSNARPFEAVIEHLALDVKVDMEARRIEGTANYKIKGTGRIIFDTDGLEILSVTLGNGEAADHSLGDSTLLGRALEVKLPKGTDRVSIAYRTGDQAKALLWLSADQTIDGKQPFLFTQGQAILTRSWIPIQDSPGIRFTYEAKVSAPVGTMAVMSATNPQAMSPDGRYSFRMDQPVPAYLMALAVGDLAFEPLGERCGVYAEPGLLKRAAWEFADTERMLEVAETLYGPYRWERYDVLVLPASFPFGGMENPRLTFATPTILAGDRSLTALIAHEMAHSWSGNLVTNATWNDLWLNEGFTVYFENRICEAVYGEDYARMHALLGHQELQATIQRFSAENNAADTRLRLDLAGRNPDDGVSDIAYEKGFAFLRLIESKVGRPKFDAFIKEYFNTFAFQSMTTDRFLAYLDENLMKPNKVELNVAEWVDGEGLPANAVVPVSDRFTKVEAEVARWEAGTPASELMTADWTYHEWVHFLRHLPQPLGADRMAELDQAFKFTTSGNSEITFVWLDHAIANNYAVAYDRLVEFLTTVGRRKFVLPLYERLASTEKGMVMARAVYAKARGNYHAVTVRSVDDKLDWRSVSQPVAF
ncbi:MAG: M1 family metallopeptidase [Flavobacteriales bacterium]|nr:M1 family metallopeptidase [Flavobacteriales bacterium]